MHLEGIQPLFCLEWIDDLYKVYCTEEFPCETVDLDGKLVYREGVYSKNQEQTQNTDIKNMLYQCTNIFKYE